MTAWSTDRSTGRRQASDESGQRPPSTERTAACPIVHAMCPFPPAAAPYYVYIDDDVPDTLLLLVLYRARTTRQTWRVVDLIQGRRIRLQRGCGLKGVGASHNEERWRASKRATWAIDESGSRPPTSSDRAVRYVALPSRRGGTRTTARSTDDSWQSTKAVEGRQLITTRSRATVRSSVCSLARAPPLVGFILT